MTLRKLVGALIATVAFSTPLSAFAAIATNTDGANQTPALAEVFIAVWDPTNGNTYVQDLGINATSTDWSTYSNTFSLDQAKFTQAFGANPSGLQYGLFAGLNDEVDATTPQDFLFYGAPKGTNTTSW